MQTFIPREKLSKQARKQLDRARRKTWGNIDPVTRKSGNKKVYDRKRSKRRWDADGERIVFLSI